MRSFFLALLLGLVLLTLLPPAADAQPFELLDGDRVVFVGDGFFEMALDDGQIALMLATRWPGRKVSIRNIGWMGDTVVGTSRDHFTNPPTPYEHLMEQIQTAAPTVAFVGYGSGLAFGDDAAFAEFETGLRALIDSLQALPARVVLLAPPPHEPEASPAPDVAPFNDNLRRAADRIAAIAGERGLPFVDLHAGLLDAALQPDHRITTNGVHLNPDGYRLAADHIATTLGFPRPVSTITIDVSEQALDTGYGEGTLLDLSPEAIRFAFQQPALPLEHETTILTVQGLRRGRYSLYIDDQKVTTATAEAWRAGIALPHAAESRQREQLRRTLLAVDDLYFQQYRPQNETYLIGFRRYEQGQNARELDLITPLLGERDNEIGRLGRPRRHTYRLVAER